MLDIPSHGTADDEEKKKQASQLEKQDNSRCAFITDSLLEDFPHAHTKAEDVALESV
jgi:hypothetical protein